MKRLRLSTAAALCTAAAQAQALPWPRPAPDQIAAALRACIAAARDGKAAEPLIRKAGFQDDDAAASDGEIGYASGAFEMAIWEEPGSCHLTVPGVPTAEMNGTVAALSTAAPGKEDEGCPLYHLSGGIDAAVLAYPVDGACDGDQGSFVRFYPN